MHGEPLLSLILYTLISKSNLFSLKRSKLDFHCISIACRIDTLKEFHHGYSSFCSNIDLNVLTTHIFIQTTVNSAKYKRGK